MTRGEYNERGTLKVKFAENIIDSLKKAGHDDINNLIEKMNELSS